MREQFRQGRAMYAGSRCGLHRLAALAFVVCAFGAAGCGEEDRSQAEAGATWLAEHRLFRPFGDIGEITRVTVESAEMIRMEVNIRDKNHVEAIDAQSLMVQSLIAKYACPNRGAEIWPILGDSIMLRVDLVAGKEAVASGICKRP